MKIKLRVEFSTGEIKEVDALASDLVAFETKFDLSIAKLETELKITHLLFLAWHSLYRQKLTVDQFEIWVDSVDTIGAAEADPKSKG